MTSSDLCRQELPIWEIPWAAIKKLVFEEKRITPAKLWDTLMADYQNEDGWKVREMLIHDAPKYGNDDDYVDNLTRDAYHVYIDGNCQVP